MSLIKKKNTSQYQTGLTFISHLFRPLQLEAITSYRIVQLNGEIAHNTSRLQRTTPRERLKTKDIDKPTSRQVTIRSHSSLQVQDLIDINLIREKSQIRLQSPHKVCRLKALQALRDGKRSSNYIIKQRTQPIYSHSTMMTTRFKGD